MPKDSNFWVTVMFTGIVFGEAMLREPTCNVCHMLAESYMEHGYSLPYILLPTWTFNHVNHKFCGTRDERFDWKDFWCGR